MDTLRPGQAAPRPAEPPAVLLVDDDAARRSLLARELAGEGFRVAEAADGAAAVLRFRDLAPSVTVLDLALPDRDGIDVLAELKGLDPAAAIVVITGRGDEEAALRAGAVSYFLKPFPPGDLVHEIRQLAAWRASLPRPALAEPAAAERVIRRSLATAEAGDPSVIEDLTLPLRGLLSESKLLGVRIGIGEMLANAIEHGNLGISAAEKEEALAQGRYDDLLAARRAVPANAAKRVSIEARVSRGQLRVTVRDEGAGFDWRRLADAGTGGTLAGRGILLARAHFDEVRWNAAGNEVTLVKRIPPIG